MVLKCFMLLYCLAVANAGVVGTAHAPTPAGPSVFSPVVTKTVSPVLSKTIITPGAPVYQTILTTHESNHKSLDGSSFSKSLDTSYSKVDKYESGPLSQVYGVPSLHQVSSYGGTSLLGTKVFPVIKTVSPTIVYPHDSVLTNTIYHQDFPYGQITPLNKNIFLSPVLTKTVTPILKKSDSVTPVLTSQVTPVYKTGTPILAKTISPVVYNPNVVTKTISPVVYNPHVVTKTISPVVYNPHVVTKSISPIVYNPQVVTKTITTPVLHKVVSPTTIIQTAPAKTNIAYSDAAVVSHMSFNGLGASYAW